MNVRTIIINQVAEFIARVRLNLNDTMYDYWVDPDTCNQEDVLPQKSAFLTNITIIAEIIASPNKGSLVCDVIYLFIHVF